MTTTQQTKLPPLPLVLNQAHERMPICADYDEDCIGVKCKTICWLYQPELGRCPYLESAK